MKRSTSERTLGSILLGQSSDGVKVELNLDELRGTRLLIQGGSGSGKSWLIRRISEQAFGKLPIIIIDPEGEFSTLREKFGFVLVGPGGETPADTRSAGLVAHKLLELHASAVCDIFELSPSARHEWVRLFLEALINAPKSLWQRALVIVDEAHMFSPERGAGTSEADEAMVALATRGRKRGLIAVFATQRLGKLKKDAAAELQNVLLGRTFIDIDRDRAIDTLGVSKSESPAFSHQLKTLRQGQFWAFGPALTSDRLLVSIGTVKTTHAQAGSIKHAAEPPPTPRHVRQFLPKLSDLPKQAEDKAATESELRRTIAEQASELVRLRAVPPAQTIQRVAPGPNYQKQIDELVTELRSIGVDGSRIDRLCRDASLRVSETLSQTLTDFRESIDEEVLRVVAKAARNLNKTRVAKALEKLSAQPAEQARVPQIAPDFRAIREWKPKAAGSSMPVGTSGLRRILVALAQVRDGLSHKQIGIRSGLSSKTGTFASYMSKARTQGWVSGDKERTLITPSGVSSLGKYDPLPTGPALAEHWRQNVGSGAARMLDEIIAVYPGALSREDLGRRVNMAHRSGTFAAYLSRLRSLSLIEGKDLLRASELVVK